MTGQYELLYILPGTKTEEEIKPLVERVHQLLVQHGATIVKTDFWGKRKLAYEIEHAHQGYYDLVEFDIVTTTLTGLEKELGLLEGVLRHQIVRRVVKTPEQLAAAQELRDRIAAKRQKTRDQETVSTMAAATEPAPPVKPAEPMSSEQLEEKLEEILEKDSIDV